MEGKQLQSLGCIIFFRFAVIYDLETVIKNSGINSKSDTPNNDDNEYIPPAYNDPCTPAEILPVYVTGPKARSIKITWTEPKAFDMNGTLLRNEQIIGIKSGSFFNGSVDGIDYNIVYIATDENGLKDSCHFNFKVYENLNCAAPEVVENGKYECTMGIMPGSTCKYTCNKGYKLVGNESITCLSNGRANPVWSRNPVCEVVQCSVPNKPENGQIFCHTNPFPYRSVCYIICEKGVTADLSLIIICQANGLWSRSTFCTSKKFEGKCISSSCNGHRCLDNNGSYSCECSDGWSGASCEQPPNTCSDNPCMNGGKCIKVDNTYECECQTKFSGLLCEAKAENGGFTEWSRWSECTASCDGGIKQRTRQCKNPLPSIHGDQCMGPLSERKECNIDSCIECPRLIHGKNSYHECKKHSHSGISECSVRCNEGFILVPAFNVFRNLTCGPQTGFLWIPANISATCVEPVYPLSLSLESSIEYLQQIPTNFYESVSKQVRNKLQSSDCFNSPDCKIDVTLQEHPSSNGGNEATDKTTILTSFTMSIKDSDRTKRTDNRIGNDVLADLLMSKIKDMENTALSLATNASIIFDIRVNVYFFYVDVETLTIKADVNCLPGQIPYGSSCITCSPGTFSGYKRCHLCMKGTFQPYEGQTRCTLCLSDQTTLTMGAKYESECVESKLEIEDKDGLEVTESYVGIIVGIIGAVAAVIALIIAILTYLYRRN